MLDTVSNILPDWAPPLPYIAGALALYMLLYSLFSPRNLGHLPTVGGPSLPILSYIGVYNYYFHNRETVQKGYDKYKGKVFKIALLDRWLVVLTGKDLVEDLRRFDDDEISFHLGATETIGNAHVFGMQVWDPPYHVELIRSVLTRHIIPFFGTIYDEIETSFRDLVPAKDNEWVPIHAIDVMREIVARVSGRVFVGLPYCRDPQYLEVAMNIAIDLSHLRKYLAVIPAALKPMYARYMSGINWRLKQALEVLEPEIRRRMDKVKQYGKEGWKDKPEDLLMWIVEEGVERGQNVETIMRNMLLAIFAAIHTSSNTFTHALYHIAANPSLLGPLREEVQRVLAEEGWSKAGMAKMKRLDSIMKESLRLNGIHQSSITRKTLKDVTLYDGTFIPSGTLLITPTVATHHDETYYKDPWTFDPWRFLDLRGDEEGSLKYQFVTTSTEFIGFGHGRHSCPGRFFAANELKAMMAYLVINYDVKFENEGIRPKDEHTIMTVNPDSNARVLFRKRKV